MIDAFLALCALGLVAIFITLWLYIRRIDNYLARDDDYEKVYDIPPPKSFEQHVRDGEGRN